MQYAVYHVAQAALFYCTQFLSTYVSNYGLRVVLNKSRTTEGLVPWSGVGSRITCAVYPVLGLPVISEGIPGHITTYNLTTVRHKQCSRHRARLR